MISKAKNHASKPGGSQAASTRQLSRVLLISWAVVSLVWVSALAGQYSKALFMLSPLLLAAWALLQFKRGANHSWRIFGGVVLLFLVIAAPFIIMVAFN